LRICNEEYEEQDIISLSYLIITIYIVLRGFKIVVEQWQIQALGKEGKVKKAFVGTKFNI